MIHEIQVNVKGQGLNDITPQVQQMVHRQMVESGVSEGLCTLFIQHTSASLLIQENYDTSAKVDLENWLNRLVPEDDPLYTHTLEGADDMPAHIKSALTAVSLSVPIISGSLALGTWQGIFLWEHRNHQACRKVIVHLTA
jgi:secondary thiamine-phosphate synthase enzyme